MGVCVWSCGDYQGAILIASLNCHTKIYQVIHQLRLWEPNKRGKKREKKKKEKRFVEIVLQPSGRPPVLFIIKLDAAEKEKKTF